MSVRSSGNSYMGRSGLNAHSMMLIFVMSIFLGCAQPTALTTGPFANTNRIDTELKRGVSTKSDVERLLGKPNGKGAAMMPPTQTKRGDIWVYYNSQTGTPRTSPGKPIRVEVDSQDQMIIVFFAGDIFDGYQWFLQTTTGAGRARLRQ